MNRWLLEASRWQRALVYGVPFGVWRGPAPEDPAVRAATAAIVAYQLPVLVRQRRWAPLVYLGFTLLASWLAVSSPPWWWAAAVLFAAMLARQLVMPAVLRRRAELLREADPPA